MDNKSKQINEYREKRKQAQRIMRELNIPAWIIIVSDNQSENAHLPLIGAPFGASRRAYILTPKRAIAITLHIEAQVQRDYGFETLEITTESMFKTIVKKLKSLLPERSSVALNFSTRFSNVDTLGHGTYRNLKREIKHNYKLISSDELILTISSSKLDFEIEHLRKAARITDQVINETFKRIRSGMKEKDVAKIVHEISEERMNKDSRIGYSWKKEFNPIVLTGEGIEGSPHMEPSNRVIKKGSTVYIDFGLSFNGFNGDLQHFGYVLKNNENRPPKKVREMYDVLVDSISAGMEKAKPGNKGWHVDKASRDVILKAGYPSYKHQTGHQLGKGNTHSPGVCLGSLYRDLTNGKSKGEKKEKNKLTQLPLKENYVMTIEPRIQVKNGASIEVDGVIKRKGFELLVPMQKRIHLVR